MIIKKFPSGPIATNTYIISCETSLEACIIDCPPSSAKAVIQYIEENQLVPQKIILTHSHWDHIGDVSFLKKHYNVPVYIHEDDVKNLEIPGSDKIPCRLSIEGVKADFFLKENDLVNVGELNFKVIHTPGHSPGSICLYSKEEKVLISGDTLFKGSMGLINLPTGNPKAMWESLKKLAKLPPETKVYPGHEGSTTIGSEPWLESAEKRFGNY